jgi:hypothetical protein
LQREARLLNARPLTELRIKRVWNPLRNMCMKTKHTFEWRTAGDGVYELSTPGDAVLRCALPDSRTLPEWAELEFTAGHENADRIKNAWWVREDDIDYLIAALQEVKEKVFPK